MAYLNTQERAELLEQLKKMRFRRAKGKLRGMDRKGRMAYYRNAQQTGELVTCFELDGLGTRVYLIERLKEKPFYEKEDRKKPVYEYVEVTVEPMAENRT
jgi:hypothetical protein